VPAGDEGNEAVNARVSDKVWYNRDVLVFDCICEQARPAARDPARDRLMLPLGTFGLGIRAVTEAVLIDEVWYGTPEA
jgi:hypothetical protein